MADDDTEKPDEKPVVVADASPPPASAPDKTPPAPSRSGPSVQELFGIPSEITKELGTIKRQEIADKDRIMRASESQVAADRALAKRHYDAAGIEAERMQPWNVTEEYRKVSTSPLEAFGSFASVFAIVASAFTHAPLENALNGSAAAMNAIKKGDDEAYERGFTAWKANMDLFQKRFNMQNTLYNDALTLMDKDTQQGRIALQNAAMRFGDKKALFLLENGFDKELIDLQTSRVRQFQAMTEARDKITESTFKDQAFQALQNEFLENNKRAPTELEKVEMWKYAHGVKEEWKNKLVDKFMIDHMGEANLPEKTAKFISALNAVAAGGSDEAKWVAQRTAEYFAKTGEEPDSDLTLKWRAEYHEQRRKTDVQVNGVKKIMEENPGMNEAQAMRQFKLESGVRNFDPHDKKYLPAVPIALRHLQVLDALTENKAKMINDPTGWARYLPQHLLAEYGGFNTPQQAWDRALVGAKSAVTQLGAGGARLKVDALAGLNRLPNNFADSGYNRGLVQELERDIVNDARMRVGLLERSGKTLDDYTKSEFNSYGIYAPTAKDQDPLMVLRSNPQALGLDQLQNLSRNFSTLPKADQERMIAEVARRKRERQQQTAPAPVQ